MPSFPLHFCSYLWRRLATHFRSSPHLDINVQSISTSRSLWTFTYLPVRFIYLFAHSNEKGLRSLQHRRINIRLSAIDLFRRCLFIRMRMFIQLQLRIAMNASWSRDRVCCCIKIDSSCNRDVLFWDIIDGSILLLQYTKNWYIWLSNL